MDKLTEAQKFFMSFLFGFIGSVFGALIVKQISAPPTIEQKSSRINGRKE